MDTKVHDEYLWREDRDISKPLEDKISYSIRRDELERKTLKLFKLVRNALIYSALGIHINETYIRSKLNNKIILPMPLSIIEDEWKR